VGDEVIRLEQGLYIQLKQNGGHLAEFVKLEKNDRLDSYTN
jgi:hypothetical protein